VERLALAEPRIAELLGGKPPRKIVVVPKRLVNIVP
jgi:leucyl-tRNA synthetase